MVKNKNCNKEVIILFQVFCDHCSTIEGESELSRNKHRTYTKHISPFVPSHWCCDQDPDSTPVYSDSPDEEEDFPTGPLDDKHWTSEIVPERTFCIHENGLPNKVSQYPCPYGNNDTVSYMDSLDLSDILDYEDYMLTTSDDEELLGMEEVPY